LGKHIVCYMKWHDSFAQIYQSEIAKFGNRWVPCIKTVGCPIPFSMQYNTFFSLVGMLSPFPITMSFTHFGRIKNLSVTASSPAVHIPEANPGVAL
jgi:hypothetical protein